MLPIRARLLRIGEGSAASARSGSSAKWESGPSGVTDATPKKRANVESDLRERQRGCMRDSKMAHRCVGVKGRQGIRCNLLQMPADAMTDLLIADLLLHVEAELYHVAVLHDILLALDAQLSSLARLSERSK